MNRAIRCDIGNARQAETCLPDSYVVSHNKLFFLIGVMSVSAALIEGALPIPIWIILTPGYNPLHMIGGSQRYSSTSRYFVSYQVRGN